MTKLLWTYAVVSAVLWDILTYLKSVDFYDQSGPLADCIWPEFQPWDSEEYSVTAVLSAGSPLWFEFSRFTNSQMIIAYQYNRYVARVNSGEWVTVFPNRKTAVSDIGLLGLGSNTLEIAATNYLSTVKTYTFVLQVDAGLVLSSSLRTSAGPLSCSDSLCVPAVPYSLQSLYADLSSAPGCAIEVRHVSFSSRREQWAPASTELPAFFTGAGTHCLEVRVWSTDKTHSQRYRFYIDKTPQSPSRIRNLAFRSSQSATFEYYNYLLVTPRPHPEVVEYSLAAHVPYSFPSLIEVDVDTWDETHMSVFVPLGDSGGNDYAFPGTIEAEINVGKSDLTFQPIAPDQGASISFSVQTAGSSSRIKRLRMFLNPLIDMNNQRNYSSNSSVLPLGFAYSYSAESLRSYQDIRTAEPPLWFAEMSGSEMNGVLEHHFPPLQYSDFLVNCGFLMLVEPEDEEASSYILWAFNPRENTYFTSNKTLGLIKVGMNSACVRIYSEDGYSTDAWIMRVYVQNNDTGLTELNISAPGGTLLEASPNDYYLDISEVASIISLSATARDVNASIAVLTELDYSGGNNTASVSGSIVPFSDPLASMSVRLLVAAESRNITRTVTITIRRVDTCGNGLRWNESEECDTGAAQSTGSGCFQCSIEPGWTCAGGSPTASDVCAEVPATSGSGNSSGNSPAENNTYPTPGTNSTDPLPEPLPGNSTDPQPGNGTDPLPGNSTDPLPGNSTDPLPANSTDPLPGNSTDPLPGNSTDPLPGNSTDPLPGNSTDPVPGNGTDSLPGNSTDPVPGNGTDPVPGNGTDPVPGNGTDPLPGNSTDPVPGNGTDPVPGNGTDPLPGNSTDPVPRNGTDPQPLPGNSTDPLSHNITVPPPDNSTDPASHTNNTETNGNDTSPLPPVDNRNETSWPEGPGTNGPGSQGTEPKESGSSTTSIPGDSTTTPHNETVANTTGNSGAPSSEQSGSSQPNSAATDTSPPDSSPPDSSPPDSSPPDSSPPDSSPSDFNPPDSSPPDSSPPDFNPPDSSSPPASNSTFPVCGDSLFSSPEECDDGNTTPGDGCSDLCMVEEGWKCEQSLISLCVRVEPNAQQMSLSQRFLLLNFSLLLVATMSIVAFATTLWLKLRGIEPTHSATVTIIPLVAQYQTLSLVQSEEFDLLAECLRGLQWSVFPTRTDEYFLTRSRRLSPLTSTDFLSATSLPWVSLGILLTLHITMLGLNRLRQRHALQVGLELLTFSAYIYWLLAAFCSIASAWVVHTDTLPQPTTLRSAAGLALYALTSLLVLSSPVAIPLFIYRNRERLLAADFRSRFSGLYEGVELRCYARVQPRSIEKETIGAVPVTPLTAATARAFHALRPRTVIESEDCEDEAKHRTMVVQSTDPEVPKAAFYSTPMNDHKRKALSIVAEVQAFSDDIEEVLPKASVYFFLSTQLIQSLVTIACLGSGQQLCGFAIGIGSNAGMALWILGKKPLASRLHTTLYLLRCVLLVVVWSSLAGSVLLGSLRPAARQLALCGVLALSASYFLIFTLEEVSLVRSSSRRVVPATQVKVPRLEVEKCRKHGHQDITTTDRQTAGGLTDRPDLSSLR